MRRRLVATAALLSTLAFAAACGDSAIIKVHGPDGGTDGGSGAFALEITTGATMTLGPGSTGTITAKLTQGGQPVSGRTLAFSTTGAAAGSTLSAAQGTTGADGTASVDLTAGTGAASFQVVVSSLDAGDAAVDVTVTAPHVDPASLTVTATYADQTAQPASAVDLYVEDQSVTCDALNLQTMPTPLVPMQTVQGFSGNGSLTFQNLTGGTYVTVLALAKNAAGVVVADGCTTNVGLTAGQTATTTVTLTKRGVQLVGTYQYQASYDMGGAMPGTVGTIIQTVGQIFNDPTDPGLYLVTLIENQIGVDPTKVPGFIQNAAISGLNDLYAKYVPPTFRKWATWVSQAAGVVTKPKVEGTFTVSDAGGSLSAKEVWQTAIFTFVGNCDPTATPGCDQRKLALAGTEVGEVTTSYPVTRADPRFNVPSHQAQIPYAQLFHLFLMQVVYPEVIPGATSTGDILNGSIDCQRVADYLDGADGTQGDGLNIAGYSVFTNAQLFSACGTVLTAIGNQIDSQLAQLAAAQPSTVDLTGVAEIHDDNHDLVCEGLLNGQWQGTIDVGGSSQAISGTWQATR